MIGHWTSRLQGQTGNVSIKLAAGWPRALLERVTYDDDVSGYHPPTLIQNSTFPADKYSHRERIPVHERAFRLHTVTMMMMKPTLIATTLLGAVSGALASVVSSASTKAVLPADFKPPQVFTNANLVHIISLEKNYVKDQINVLIQNTAKEPQDEYYVPFTADQFGRVGGFEAKDRKDAEAGPFTVEAVEYDPLA